MVLWKELRLGTDDVIITTYTFCYVVLVVTWYIVSRRSLMVSRNLSCCCKVFGLYNVCLPEM